MILIEFCLEVCQALGELERNRKGWKPVLRADGGIVNNICGPIIREVESWPGHLMFRNAGQVVTSMNLVFMSKVSNLYIKISAIHHYYVIT